MLKGIVKWFDDGRGLDLLQMRTTLIILSIIPKSMEMVLNG